MDGLAVIDAVFFLIVVGYIGVPAVLRRIPADAEHDRRSALDEYGATNKAEFLAVANLEGVVVRATERTSRALDTGVFRGRDVEGKAVLVHTGWDVHWRTERYGTGHPFITRAAAEHLVAAGAALVGIDSLNIDDATDGARPAHTLLLGAGIPIVEHLCGLRALPDAAFRFFAVPVKVRGMGSFPVRAFAVLEE